MATYPSEPAARPATYIFFMFINIFDTFLLLGLFVAVRISVLCVGMFLVASNCVLLLYIIYLFAVAGPVRSDNKFVNF